MNQSHVTRPLLKVLGFLTICAFSMSFAHAWAGSELKYASPANWVKGLDLPKPDKAYSGAPAQILQQNMQVRFEPDGTTTYYTEVALHIQTPAGLQGAQAFVVWNPDTDEATVHKLQILRGDEVIDVLAKGQSFTTLRREQNLDRAMLDGYLTGVLQPEGMQVGDTMVFASSIRRRDPALGGNVEAVLQGLSAMPVVQQSIRATWQTSQGVRWRQSEDLRGKISKDNNEQTFLLERMHILPKDLQNDAPARFNQYGLVEFTQFASWQEISKLLAPKYNKARTLSPGSSLHQEAASIKKASPDIKVQAGMALQLVQNQVRYVYLGMNLGGYIPADADTTWQRRFGDCKGKTVLLIALLNELGIKAEAALVNTDGGDGLDQRLPSFELFDHVIVRADINGQVYWMDGTRQGDSSLDSLPGLPLRWALPITDAGSALEALPMKALERPASDSFLRLDASNGLDKSAPAHAEVIFRGDTAIQFNMGYNALPEREREKGLRAFWSDQYNWIEPRKVSAVFDAATGEERLTMDGAAKMEWLESEDKASWRYQTDIMRLGWAYGVKRNAGPKREVPVVLDFPYYERTREEIVLPNGGKDFKMEGESIDKTVGGSEFKRTVSLKDGVVLLEASKRALVPEISYEDAMAVTDSLTDLWAKDVMLIAPKRYKKNTAAKTPVAEASAAEVEKSVDDWLNEGKTLASQNKNDEALIAFNKVLRTDDKNVAALEGRGYILAKKGNFVGAAADFELAHKIDPTQWTVLTGLGLVRGSQGRFDDAIAAFTTAIELYPNDVPALVGRGKGYLAIGKVDLAKQDAQSAKDLYPDYPEILDLEIRIAIAEKHPDDAKSLVRQALSAAPNDVSLHMTMAELLENCTGLDYEGCVASKASAVAEYDAVIAIKPTAYAYAMRAQDRPKTERAERLKDIDDGIKLDPKSNLPLLVRAAIMINEDKDYEKALIDLAAAIAIDPKESQPYRIRSGVYFKMGKPKLATADLDTMKRTSPDKVRGFNESCWERATHNIELDIALADCDTAVTLMPKNPAVLDSRGFVKLRLGRFDDALADYEAALALKPDLAASLYGRGLAKLRKGDKQGGNADLKSARKIFTKVDEQFEGYGVKP